MRNKQTKKNQIAETVLKAQAPLAAILESKMAASTLPVAILD